METKPDIIAEAIKKCPFLRNLALTQGEAYARRLASDRSRSLQERQRQPDQKRDEEQYNKVFSAIHGANGVIPLIHEWGTINSASEIHEKETLSFLKQSEMKSFKKSPISSAASISLSGFFNNFDPFKWDENSNKNKKSQSPKKNFKSSSSSQQPGGKCPMRRILGPIASVVMSNKLHCPKPIVVMRAALAKTEFVRSLRIETLPVKLLAVGLLSALLNFPFGVVRAHCHKFSPEWFVIVHATIPFVAMLRKAIIMPKYSILLTIAAAVIGQAAGSRIENTRIRNLQFHNTEKNYMENSAINEINGSSYVENFNKNNNAEIHRYPVVLLNGINAVNIK